MSLFLQNIETSDDICASVSAGSCAGKVKLAAQVQLPIDTSNLVMPGTDDTPEQINASPIAAAVKDGLAAALAGVTVPDITVNGITTVTSSGRRRLQDDVDGIAVDYVIALPPAAAATAKADSATMTVPDVVVPAEATTTGSAITVASADIVAPPLKSYAWVEAAATCPTECGAASSTPANTFTCAEDGVSADHHRHDNPAFPLAYPLHALAK